MSNRLRLQRYAFVANVEVFASEHGQKVVLGRPVIVHEIGWREESCPAPLLHLFLRHSMN